MKECWDEGGLRAYLDRELPPEEMTRMAIHLGGCAACHAQYNELAGRAARVAAWMEALEVGRAVSPRPAVRRWKPAVAVLALAATLASAFILLPKRTQPPALKPVAAPRVAPARTTMVQAAAPTVEKPERLPARAKSQKRAKPPEVQYYLALDDEPIDTGVVMRVALDGTGVQADVIFDSEGRPRAIRTVK
jgi:anti-sigma factor RsiW